MKELLRRLQQKFKHKFCHKFKDCVSPMCNCGTQIETIKHFFLALSIFFSKRQNLHGDLRLTDPSTASFGKESLSNALLYWSDSVLQNTFLRFNVP